MHKPLSFIKNSLIWLPISGPALKGRKIGEAILPFQESVIKSALSAKGEPRRNIFMGFSRKISKSMIFSWILNERLETQTGYQMVCAASTYQQSDIIFSLVKSQIELNPLIKKDDYKITLDRIENIKKGNSLFKVYSKGSSNLGFLNISLAVMDELGAWQTRSNLDSILSGLAMAQNKPLLLFAANRPEMESHWSVEYLKTLKGDNDWRFFEYSAGRLPPYSRRAKEKANPFYKEFLKSKNPLLKGVFNFINKEAERAKQSLENEISYRKFQLGQACQGAAAEWISIADLQDFKEFPTKRVVAGFDIALSDDFSACVLASFEGDSIFVWPILHVANTNKRRPSQKRQFENWHSKGDIKIQRRPALDKSVFISDVKETMDKLGAEPLAYAWDPNMSAGFKEEFAGEPVLYRQSPANLTFAIRWLQARGKEKNIFVNNLCMRWMIGHALASLYSKSYLTLKRPTRFLNVDGCHALCNAAKWSLENPPETDFAGFAV